MRGGRNYSRPRLIAATLLLGLGLIWSRRSGWPAAARRWAKELTHSEPAGSRSGSASGASRGIRWGSSHARPRVIAATLLLGIGLIGTIIGGSTLLMGWHAAWSYQQSDEARQVERQLADL